MTKYHVKSIGENDENKTVWGLFRDDVLIFKSTDKSTLTFAIKSMGGLNEK